MTKEEAIDCLEGLKIYLKIEYIDQEAVDMAIAALSADAKTKCIVQIKVDTEEVIKHIKEEYDIVDKWIPCSERLPNEDGQYLVFYEGTIIGSRIEIMWYSEPSMPNVDVSGKHFYRSDSEWGDIIYDEVIAWMPLPKPYRKDGK